MLDLARTRLAGLPVTLVQANFDQMTDELERLGIDKVDGVLADLGVRSDQIDIPDAVSVFSSRARWICEWIPQKDSRQAV